MASSLLRSSAHCLRKLPSVVCVRCRHMPVCSVKTNIKKSDIPTDFSKGLTSLLARILNKPEKSFSISVQTGVDMIRAYSDCPTVTVHIWSFGVFDASRNLRYSKEVLDFIMPQLKLTPDRWGK